MREAPYSRDTQASQNLILLTHPEPLLEPPDKQEKESGDLWSLVVPSGTLWRPRRIYYKVCKVKPSFHECPRGTSPGPLAYTYTCESNSIQDIPFIF